MHAHILPGVDDGSSSLEESLAMARRFVRLGYRAVVATPHFIDGEPAAAEIRDSCDRLQQELRRQEIPLEVFPGAEIYLDFYLLEQLERGEVLGLGGGEMYLLLELSALQPLPVNLAEIFFTLSARGYRLVISHPERIRALQENPEILYQLVHKGALSQVTLGSLTGLFGPEAARAAMTIHEHNLGHFLVTDAHDTGSRLTTVPQAVEMVRERWGEEAVQRYLVTNPGCVLAGEDFMPASPLPPGARKPGGKRSLYEMLKIFLQRYNKKRSDGL